MISTKEQLEKTVLEYGLLPFFSNNIRSFSVEEMTAPGMLFGGNNDYDGCWEWKGPVIQEMSTAYGKFFRRKAGFVSLGLYTDFINYRRHAYPLKPGSTESCILDIINSREAATSSELRKIIFGIPEDKRTAEDPVEHLGFIKQPRQVLESPLQRLQMGGSLLIADFQYKYTRYGERYGWGEALYTTPEIWFGKETLRCDRTPAESFQLLVDHLEAKLPGTNREEIVKLLR